jgi:hypothetical protein
MQEAVANERSGHEGSPKSDSRRAAEGKMHDEFACRNVGSSKRSAMYITELAHAIDTRRELRHVVGVLDAAAYALGQNQEEGSRWARESGPCLAGRWPLSPPCRQQAQPTLRR